MKYVTFTKLKIKNFLSIGNEQVIIDFREGIHIITGINKDKEDRKNGLGKSSIADAFYFAIFGNTLREIKKDLIINNVTNDTCEVQLDFNVNSHIGNNNFTIIRQLNPSKLYVFKDGADKTRDSIANTNEYISAVLSSSQEIFQNCVIMTLNNTIPFMAKGKVEKRKFIEQIFNLQIFSAMLLKLRDEYNEVKSNLDIEVTKYDEVKNTVESLQRKKDLSVAEKQGKLGQIKLKIDANIASIEKLRSELKEKEPIEADIAENKTELDEINRGREVISSKVKVLIAECADLQAKTREKIAFNSAVGTSADICPTCLRPVSEHDREDIYKKKSEGKVIIANLRDEWTLKSDTQNDWIAKENILSRAALKAADELNSLKVKLNSLVNIEPQIQRLLDVNKQMEDSINSVNVAGDTYDDLITTNTARMDAIKIELENIKKALNLLDVVKFVVSEEGVKSYLVKKILQSFNAKLSSYLKKLDSNSICIFNEYFDEEILNEKGKISSYNNFSGAERKAIDLACLFAFMDMRKAQGDVYYNISIYDELFDSSLDEKGVEIVLSILKDRCIKYKECVLVISHRKESIKAATGDVIFLEKKNGVTRRVIEDIQP